MPPDLPEPSSVVHRYGATVAWSGTTGVGYDRYDRTHRAVTVPPTEELHLSGDPAFGGDPARLNPEQLLVLAAASCQLLSFLAVAARARLEVIAYQDEAEAVMPEDDRPVRITAIALRPHITVVAPEERRAPVEVTVRRLCEVAHRECYIANSVRSEITVEPTITVRSREPSEVTPNTH
jgi:organic hydroperoxide reductase OsmC/OhrA